MLAEYAVLFEAIEAIEDEHFVFRVWAVGMDWRNDLAKAAEHLKQEIERIHAHTGYPELGTQGVHYEAGTHKALVITHSQGSLIARYASEVLGARAMIQGVIHLNQPTTGAPALFRRFLTGAGLERENLFFNLGRLKSTGFNNVFSEVLGTTRYHFTRMAGPMVGALCLLPTNDYMHKPGAKNAQWLNCPPRGLKPQVINDIYTDVYLNDKVGLISHPRYDAMGQPKPYTAKEFMKVRFTKKVGAALEQTLSKAGGLLKEFILGQATAPREGGVKDFRPEEIPPDADYYLPEESPWHQDNMRLRPHKGMTEEEREIADVWFKEFKNYLLMAQAFHATLGLKYHPSTYVICSNGMNTVTQVRLLLTQDKNGDSVLDCPYERTKEGDGTVPLISQEALTAQGAKIIGPVITAGNVVHAKICEHIEAIDQAQAAIKVLMEELRLKDQDRLYVS